MKPESWESLEEIAEHLKVSTDTIHRWIRAKRIPVHKVGRFWRFRVSEVDAWVLDGKAGTGRDVRNGDHVTGGQQDCLRSSKLRE